MNKNTPSGVHAFGDRDSFSNTILNDKELRHLLKRTLLGVSLYDVESFNQSPLSSITKELLTAFKTKTFPLKDYSAINTSIPDAKILLGETWVGDINFDPVINYKRKISLKNWLIGLLYSHNRSLKPKMTLFWHSIFVIQLRKISLSNNCYEYFDFLFNNSLTNYQTLFLGQITSLSVSEYHRKLMKSSKDLHKSYSHYILSNYLFGGDCSKYMSKDRIRRFAKMLHEWNIINDNFYSETKKIRNTLTTAKNGHPTEEAFPSIVPYKNGIADFISELKVFTKKLLHHEVIASKLSVKLYKSFVSPQIDLESYTRFVNPLTDIMIRTGYDMRTVLEYLFHHDEFYNPKYFGCLVKSPIEFLFGLSKEFHLGDVIHANHTNNYPFWEWIQVKAASLEQSLGDPPNEYGWPAYNTFPFEQLWIEEEVLSRRNIISAELIERAIDFDHKIIQNDILRIFSSLQDSSNLYLFINSVLQQFFQIEFSHQKKMELKDFLCIKHQITEADWKHMLYNIQHKTASEHIKIKTISIVKDLLTNLLTLREYQMY